MSHINRPLIWPCVWIHVWKIKVWSKSVGLRCYFYFISIENVFGCESPKTFFNFNISEKNCNCWYLNVISSTLWQLWFSFLISVYQCKCSNYCKNNWISIMMFKKMYICRYYVVWQLFVNNQLSRIQIIYACISRQCKTVL